jgi:MFS family permease
MFTALAERDYAWYLSGTMAFFMAMQMQLILRGFLAFDLTNAATALGVISASAAIPMLVSAPIAGTLADRVNKRTLLMVSQTGSALSALIMSLLILTSDVQFWQLAVVSVVSGLFMSFNMPARQAIVPQLVPQHKLMNAVSLQQAGMNVTRILGPALAGLLIAPVGVGWAYMVTFVLFVLATVSELHLPKHGMKNTRPPQKFRKDLMGGFRYIAQNRLIAQLLILGLVFPLFAFPLQMMLPVFASDVFGRPDTGLGLLAMATGVGGLTGATLAARMHGFPMKGRLMFAGGVWMALLFIVFTQTSSFLPALIFLGIGNIGGMVFQTTNQTVIQARLPAEVRGRVMSVTMMSFGLMPLGVLPVTIAADKFGAQTAVLGSSIVLLATVILFFLLSTRLRRLRVEQLTQVQLSPAQAATRVASGQLTQAEADRLSGKTPATSPADPEAAQTPAARPQPPPPLPLGAAQRPAASAAALPLAAANGAAAVETDTRSPRLASPQPPARSPAWVRRAWQPVMIALAVAGGMTLALAATVPWDERWRGFLQRLADALDPDPRARRRAQSPRRWWDRR